MTHTTEPHPVEGPHLMAAEEHDAQHGGRGDPYGPTGANYILNADGRGRGYCWPCGAVVEIGGGNG